MPGAEHTRSEPRPAVECRSLEVRYGERVAVDGLSFAISRGEVLAILGPNGAGKTSTVETLEGYRRPSAGRGPGPRTRPAKRPPGTREADRGDAPARRRLPDRHRPPGRLAVRRATTKIRRTLRRFSGFSIWTGSRRLRGNGCQEASSSASLWLSHSSASRTSSSSTSRPPGSTLRDGSRYGG